MFGWMYCSINHLSLLQPWFQPPLGHVASEPHKHDFLLLYVIFSCDALYIPIVFFPIFLCCLDGDDSRWPFLSLHSRPSLPSLSHALLSWMQEKNPRWRRGEKMEEVREDIGGRHGGSLFLIVVFSVSLLVSLARKGRV